MLSYDEFKKAFIERFPEYMGISYQGYVVKPRQVIKRGIKRDSFVFVNQDSDSGGATCTPTIYFDEIYKSYIGDEDFERELNNVAVSLKRAFEEQESLTKYCNLDHMKNNVIAELVNTDSISDFIDECPHRSFLDLTIIYRWLLRIDEKGVYSGIINYDLMEKVDLTEEKLYEIALSKTKDALKFEVETLDKQIEKLMKRDGIDKKIISETVKEIEESCKMLVIVNKNGFRASTALIYEDFLMDIANKLNSDYYIMPASCNESIIFPDDGLADPEALLRIHISVCSEPTNDYDQLLSWNIYHFSRDNKLEVIKAEDY